TDVRVESAFDQVVTHRRGDCQQQTRCSRQGCCQTTCGDQADNPARQVGDFRVGQYQDIVVNNHLVAFPATLGSGSGEVHALVVIQLDTAVVVLDRKSTCLNSSHVKISYAVFC